MERSHVMALGVDYQDVLWTLLYNFHGMFTLGQMQNVQDEGAEADPNHRHALVMQNLDQVLEIMNIINEVRRGNRRVRTFFFSPKAMDVIRVSIEVYHDQQNVLNVEDCELVRRNFPGVRDLVATSLQYCYTREELRKAGIKT